MGDRLQRVGAGNAPLVDDLLDGVLVEAGLERGLPHAEAFVTRQDLLYVFSYFHRLIRPLMVRYRPGSPALGTVPT